jgi:hypothetical protein
MRLPLRTQGGELFRLRFCFYPPRISSVWAERSAQILRAPLKFLLEKQDIKDGNNMQRPSAAGDLSIIERREAHLLIRLMRLPAVWIIL